MVVPRASLWEWLMVDGSWLMVDSSWFVPEASFSDWSIALLPKNAQ